MSNRAYRVKLEIGLKSESNHAETDRTDTEDDKLQSLCWTWEQDSEVS